MEIKRLIKKLLSSQLRINMVSGVMMTVINISLLAVAYPVYLYIQEKKSGMVEFYDLRLDRGAQHNLGTLHPKVATYAKLEDNTVIGTTRQTEMDEKTRRQLKSLGYLR